MVTVGSPVSWNGTVGVLVGSVLRDLHVRRPILSTDITLDADDTFVDLVLLSVLGVCILGNGLIARILGSGLLTKSLTEPSTCAAR